MREGPAPGAQVSLQLDLPWPSTGAYDPLGGVDALPRPSSCGNVAFDAHLVNPRAKRPRDTAQRPNSAAGGSLPWCSPPPCSPAWTCWVLKALVTRHALAACPEPPVVASLWRLGSPCPPLLWIGQPPIPLCLCPPPVGGGGGGSSVSTTGWFGPGRLAQRCLLTKSCRNNTYCCSDKGVALVRGGAGGIVASSIFMPPWIPQTHRLWSDWATTYMGPCQDQQACYRICIFTVMTNNNESETISGLGFFGYL